MTKVSLSLSQKVVDALEKKQTALIEKRKQNVTFSSVAENYLRIGLGITS